MPPVPLEVKDRIHYMLEDAWAGDGPFFGYVADEEGREARGLGKNHELSRRFPNLTDRTGGGLELGSEDRLNGVDDRHFGLEFPDVLHDFFQGIFRQDVEIRGSNSDTISTHFGLAEGFFSGDVKDVYLFFGQPVEGLQEKGGFPDPRVATDEDHGPDDHPSSQDPIKLADLGSNAAFFRSFNGYYGLRGEVLS